MTPHSSVRALFDNLGVQIYDAKDKEVDQFMQLMELFHMGRIVDQKEVAQYCHEKDKIYIPSNFGDYDRVALHELIHWTGHPNRLARRHVRYAKEVCCPVHAYNLEELVAEIGSLILCERLGVTPEDDRRRPLAGWRSTFRGSQSHTKKEAYAVAVRDAEEAVTYIMGLAQAERKAA